MDYSIRTSYEVHIMDEWDDWLSFCSSRILYENESFCKAFTMKSFYTIKFITAVYLRRRLSLQLYQAFETNAHLQSCKAIHVSPLVRMKSNTRKSSEEWISNRIPRPQWIAVNCVDLDKVDFSQCEVTVQGGGVKESCDKMQMNASRVISFSGASGVC